LQRALVRTRDDAATATIVEQRINRLLQHALFVADDDVRRTQFHQPLQTIVAIDDAAIEVVQIGGREAAAIERHQRTKFRRNDRDDRHDHPFRAVSGFRERLDELQALGELLRLQFRSGLGNLHTQLCGDLFQIKADQQFADRFSTDAGSEAVLAILILRIEIFFFREKLTLLERGQTRLQNDVVLEIKNALEILQRHVEQKADAGRQRLQEPDMRNRSRKLDMAHALAPDLRE